MTSMHGADNKTYRNETQTCDKEADHAKCPTSFLAACRTAIFEPAY